MQVDRLGQTGARPSTNSFYHTVLQQSASPAAASAESLASSSSAATTNLAKTPEPELVYDIIQRRREGTALVIEHPTLVNFVPTSDIQTAVSVTDDRIVIDTILPPTATLKRHYATAATSPGGNAATGAEKQGFDTTAVLEKHKRELYQLLTTKLTENYDPTGTIKDDIFATLTQLTRFPDPKGTNRSPVKKGQCPCICCEVGCSRPLEPGALDTPVHRTTADTSKTAALLAQAGVASDTVVEPTTSTHLNGTIPSQPAAVEANFATIVPDDNRKAEPETAGMVRSKSRFGFLTFGRSKKELPVPAPALPPEVTSAATPTTGKPVRSRSLSDLVRRRRSKHQAASSKAGNVPPVPTIPASATAPAIAGASSTATAPAPVRHSLDSLPADGPSPPPRRSSKLYAIVNRKSLSASSSTSSLPATRRASMSATNGIARIVEEDEMVHAHPAPLEGNHVDQRQSMLMSSFEPPVHQDAAARQTAGLRGASNDQVTNSHAPTVASEQSQIGVAI